MVNQLVIHYLQIISSLLIIFPVFYWVISRWSQKIVLEPDNDFQSNGYETTILLPMRNEEGRLNLKIRRVIDEIKTHENVDLLIIDSCSSDSTYDSCLEVLNDSDFPAARWNCRRAILPGKSKAVNLALDSIECEILIVMDTDTQVESGWLGKIWGSFEEHDIAVISGIEAVQSPSKTVRAYKTNSNYVRMMDSSYHSSPILEGGVMAIRLDMMDGFRLDEGTNADDAQISIEAIRRGHKSKIVQSLRFYDTNPQKSQFRRSLRRSQGLSRVLSKNLDLVLKANNPFVRVSYINSFLTYVVVPWATTIMMLTCLANLSLGGLTELQNIVGLVFISLSALLPQGKALIWGSLISVISHVQLAAGINYSSWDPNTQ